MSTLRILVADDHYVVRMGLCSLIRSEPGMEVVAEAADGLQTIEKFRQTRPDVAMVDVRMPGRSGIEAARAIIAEFPSAKLLMLTAYDGDEEIHQALAAGALGYVLKATEGEKLLPAIRAVALGQKWLPAEVSRKLAARKTFDALTPREVEVLQKCARGLANKQIADELQISENTVKDHLKRIREKLRVCDRTEAVTAGIKRGIIQLK
jgi:DNA-binding NarL/FixJ family response regulator